MRGKHIYFTHNELMSLLGAIKLFDEYADDATLKFILEFGLEKAWKKIIDKLMEDVELEDE